MLGRVAAIGALFILILTWVVYAQIDIRIVNMRNEPTQFFTPPDLLRVEVRPITPFRGRLCFSFILPNGQRQPVYTADYCQQPLWGTETFNLMSIDEQTTVGRYTLIVEARDCQTSNILFTKFLDFEIRKSPPPPPPSPTPPPPSPTIPTEFIIALAAVIVTLGGVALYMKQRSGRQVTPIQTLPPPPAPPPPSREPTAVKPPTTVVGTPLAFLELPNGVSIPITVSSKEFGREDLAAYVPHNLLRYISSRHFRIYFSGGTWFIEDLNSTNGTVVDGRQIRGAGPVEIKAGSVIQPAGVIKLTFRPITTH